VSDPNRPRGTLRFEADDPDSVPVRDAATVMLLRDGDDGLEVFMLLRNLKSDFVGGAYVFPGGGVDAGDGPAGSDASFRLAAIRESFEEAGLLLATHVDGSIVSFRDPVVAERFTEHRRAVDSGERSILDVCEEEGLRPATDALVHFSRWVTPLGSPRRYDTRFLVAHAPPEQVGLHDDREVVANLWIRPEDALERHAGGDFEMIFPTVRTLEDIARFDRADDVLADAAARGPIERVEPTVDLETGAVLIELDGVLYDGESGQPHED
jgi:8-oxo-dGTP pyrophosphatase MutT (NUDIX family)